MVPQAYAVHHQAVPAWRQRVAAEALRAWAGRCASVTPTAATASDSIPRHTLVPALVQQLGPLTGSDLVADVEAYAWRRRLVELCAPKLKAKPRRVLSRVQRPAPGRRRSFA